MDFYRRFVTELIPDALRKVPVPDSIFGVFKLSASELTRLTIFTGVSGFLAYSVYTTCRHHFSAKSGGCPSDPIINWSVQKDRDKVVNTLDIEDIAGDKACMCRCWRSKKFPYCDGAHGQHNADTADNVGPVIVKKAN